MRQPAGHEARRPADQQLFPHALRDPAGELRRGDALPVLREIEAGEALVHREGQEGAEIFDTQDASSVVDVGKDRRLPDKGDQQGIVSLAALAEDHGRAQDADLEALILKRLQPGLRLQLGAAVMRGRAGLGARRDHALVQPVHAHRAHVDELPDAFGLRLAGDSQRQVSVDFIILGRVLCRLPHMGKPRRVKDRVVRREG